jgi:hypothetical protein
MEDLTDLMRTRSVFVCDRYRDENKLYDIIVFGKEFKQICPQKINALQTFVWLTNMAHVNDFDIKFNKKSWLMYCEYYSEHNAGAYKLKDNCFIGITDKYRVYDEELSFLKK